MVLNKNASKKWIGLGKIVSNSNYTLQKSAKAYVNILGIAKSKISFRNKAKTRLKSIGIELLRLEKAEPLKDRMVMYKVEKKFWKLPVNCLKRQMKLVLLPFMFMI